MNNSDLHRELKEYGSVLSKTTKRYIVDSSSVPKGYFESMENRFMNSIHSTQPGEARGFNWGRFSASVGMAAVLIAGLVMTFNYINTREMAGSELSRNEVLDYLEAENIYEEPQMISQNNTELSLDNLSKKDIENYFIENGIYDAKTLKSI